MAVNWPALLGVVEALLIVACSVLIPFEYIRAAVRKGAASVVLLFTHPKNAAIALWSAFWGSWGPACTVWAVMTGLAVSDFVGYGLSKALFVVGNLLLLARVCVAEELHGKPGARKALAIRFWIIVFSLIGLAFVSFFECGMVSNRQRGNPATISNILKSSFWWRSSVTSPAVRIGSTVSPPHLPIPATQRPHSDEQSRPQYLYIANNGGHSIRKARINADGTLGSFLVTRSDAFRSLDRVGPLLTGDNILLIGEPFRTGEPGSGAVLLYKIGPHGSISPGDSLPGFGYFSATLDSNANFVYTSGRLSIIGAAINGDKFVMLPGSPFRSSCPVPSPSGPPPDSMCTNSLQANSLQLSPDRRFLYGIFDDTQLSRFGFLGTITINADGTLGRFADFVDTSRLPCSYFKTRIPVSSLVVIAKAQRAFIYQSCVDQTGSQYTIGISAADRSNGRITDVYPEYGSVSGGNLFPVLADPSGNWLLAFDSQPYRAGKLHVLFVDPNSGDLTESAKHAFPVAGDLLAFAHQGRFLYIANSANNNVTAYRFDHTGVISPIPNAMYPAGPQPTAMVVSQPNQ